MAPLRKCTVSRRFLRDVSRRRIFGTGPVRSGLDSVKIGTIEASDASKLGHVSAAQLRLVTGTLVHRLGGE